MSTERLKKDLIKNSGIRKCFQAIVDRKKVDMTKDILYLMLEHELQVDLNKIDDNLSAILPYMLIVYIRNWPGWQRSVDYYSGKLSFRGWFLKFYQYILVRVTCLIKREFNEVMKEMNEISTENNKETDLEISIECPANVLNRLYFFSNQDDILMGSVNAISTNKFTLRELVNFLYVEIQFSNKELSLSRINRTDIDRRICLSTYKHIYNKPVLIEAIKRIDSDTEQKSYTLNYLWAYFYQYMDIIKSRKDFVSKTNIELLEVLVEEIFKDVLEWDLNSTIGSNSSILFNIGCKVYTRRKCKSSTNQEIIYSETLTPKIETKLIRFADQVKEGNEFESLKELKAKLDDDNIDLNLLKPVFKLSCTFCGFECFDCEDFQKHFNDMHSSELLLCCVYCKKRFEVRALCGERWKHNCK